jgi:hypothetical protein
VIQPTLATAALGTKPSSHESLRDIEDTSQLGVVAQSCNHSYWEVKAG